jgi:hypothetical protein
MSDESVPLDDLRAIAEVLADVLTERGLVAPEPGRPRRVLNAADPAEILGRDRRWVYAHAEELGAFRYGDGPKGRLGFDLEVIERWKRSVSSPRREGARLAAGGRRRASQPLVAGPCFRSRLEQRLQ